MTSIWLKVAFVLGLIAAGFGAYKLAFSAGERSARAECNVEALKAQLKKVTDDLARIRAAAAQAERDKAELAKQADATTGKINDLEKELAASDEALTAAHAAALAAAPAGECKAAPQRGPDLAPRATSDDIRRLRQLGPD